MAIPNHHPYQVSLLCSLAHCRPIKLQHVQYSTLMQIKLTMNLEHHSHTRSFVCSHPPHPDLPGFSYIPWNQMGGNLPKTGIWEAKTGIWEAGDKYMCSRHTVNPLMFCELSKHTGKTKKTKHMEEYRKITPKKIQRVQYMYNCHNFQIYANCTGIRLTSEGGSPTTRAFIHIYHI